MSPPIVSDINTTLTNKKIKSSDKLTIIKSIQPNVLSHKQSINLISCLLSLSDDKSIELRETIFNTLCSIIDTFSYFSVDIILEVATHFTENVGFRSKIQSVRLIKYICDNNPYFRHFIPPIIYPLSEYMHDNSIELVEETKYLLEKIFNKIDNKDLTYLIPQLITCMENVSELSKTIDKLASTTFVQTVDSQTLSVVVPLLIKAMKIGTNSTKRQVLIISENMSKLVEDPYDALVFIDNLIHPINYVEETMSDPEVRLVCNRVINHLNRIKSNGLEMENKKQKIITDILKLYPNFTIYDKQTILNMMDLNVFTYDNIIETFNNISNISDISYKMINIYNSITVVDDIQKDIDAEELCRCEFSLGYGSKVLLHKTVLHLYRGYKYGLIGQNNSGKSTLMKSIANNQVENFPTHLKSVYVETDILGELSHLSCIEYIMQDTRLKDMNLTETFIENSLKSFGFTEQMLSNSVSTLSGGWRMKLALSRAMMQKADILLMDEPSAHLDVINVKWLLDYIKGLSDVTCIIVSQNSKLLDECCTHIIHIDNMKIKNYRGNLTEFVKINPSALSYFELKSNKYEFKFPTPSFLDGVKSKGKALIKMDDVTFTYPSNKSPTITNASVQVSLSSRIGCVGPNGAGKSTSVKILTGQLQPQEGIVWTYPGVKIGYIAQHAFAHIENHLDKTPNEYIRWRYETGEDKEGLDRITMKMTEEDEAKLDKNIMVDNPENIRGAKIKRIIKRLTNGRRVGKRSREYEVELENCSSEMNMWLEEDDLIKRGYHKLLKIIDSKCDAAENSYRKTLTMENVQLHLEGIGMDSENANHTKIKQLSNGEKVKVVLGAALWFQPHILILDEPTNNLDRDGLAALSVAIKDFEGGIIIITHDEQFCKEICKETWVIENGILNIKGDPDWMKNALNQKTDFKQEDEIIDANGNIIKLKQKMKQLTRKEKMARDKYRKMRRELGEDVSSSDDDCDM